MPRLVIKFGQKLERVIELDVQKLVIGRGTESDLVIDSELVSRTHCHLRLVGDGYVVEDLHSKSGTFVNGERIEAHILQKGDAIELGKYTLTYQDSPKSAAPGKGEAIETGAFWADALTESSGSFAAPTRDSWSVGADQPAEKASELVKARNRQSSIEQFSGTMLASEDELARVRATLLASQGPHLQIKVKGKVEKIALDKPAFEVGFYEGADFRIDGARFFGKKQFGVKKSGDAFMVEPRSFWATVTLDGEKVKAPTMLKEGANIEAGGVRFRFSKGS
jgi:pSer/pThr/pTyr-binding forkhead associated (FHA) protein